MITVPQLPQGRRWLSQPALDLVPDGRVRRLREQRVRDISKPVGREYIAGEAKPDDPTRCVIPVSSHNVVDEACENLRVTSRPAMGAARK